MIHEMVNEDFPRLHNSNMPVISTNKLGQEDMQQNHGDQRLQQSGASTPPLMLFGMPLLERKSLKFKRAWPISRADMLLRFSSTPLPGRMRLFDLEVLADMD